MKKCYQLFAIALAVVLLLSALPFAAAAAEGQPVGYASGSAGQCQWTLSDSGVLTISGDGAMPDYTSSGSLPWGRSIKSVVIQDGVTNIGAYAFYNCPDLKTVTIAPSVASSGYYAFSYCKALNRVNISDLAAWCRIDFTNAESNPVYLAHNLYLNGALVTDLVIPDGVTELRLRAFVGCTCLTSVTIPESVTSIGDRAFYGCTGLTEVVIPDSVTIIDQYAFAECTGLTAATIPESVTVIDQTAFNRLTMSLVITCFTGSAAESFAKTYGYQAIVIPFRTAKQDDGTVAITKFAGGEADVVIPSTILGRSVSALGKWAFANNTEVESVTIPDSITEIAKGAFYNCTELTTVTMGDNVTSIGANAFEKCLYLQNIDLGDQLQTIGDEAFYDCRRLQTLQLPQTVTAIGDEAFTNCKSLTGLNIPRGVQKLGEEESTGYGVFENCVNLSEVQIPLTVTYMKPNTFAGCGDVTVASGLNTYAQRYAADKQLRFKTVYSESVGNPNLDRKISIRDVTAIQRHLAEFDILSAEQFPLADCNRDGVVNINDATLLQQYLAEYDVTIG